MSGNMFEVTIVEFVMVQTGTYGDQHYRPYQTGYNAQTARIYDDYTEQGKKITPMTVAGIAGQIIRPSTETAGVVGISEGWDTRRFRFYMKVRVGMPGQDFGETEEYLTGYSDYADVSINGKPDPRTKLYFNNSVITRTARHGRGNQRSESRLVVDASHVIVSPEISSGSRSYNRYEQHDDIKLMTPMDIMDELDKSTYHEEVIDQRNSLRGGEVRKSKRRWGLPTEMLSGSLVALEAASKMSEAGGVFAQNNDTIYTHAREMVREQHVSDDRFLTWLDDNTQFSEDRYITYGDMMHHFDGLDHVVEVIPMSEPMKRSLPRRGDAADWNSSENEAVVATILGYSVPAIMMELMIMKLSFMITNDNRDGRFGCEIFDVDSFADVDLKPYVAQVINRLEFEVFPDISHRNQISICVKMNVDIVGDSYITISYNGGPPIDFIIPSFSDGLFAPIVTPRADNIEELARDLGSLARAADFNDDHQEYAPRRNRRDSKLILGDEINELSARTNGVI